MGNFSLVTIKGVGGGDEPLARKTGATPGTPTILKAKTSEDGRTLTGFKSGEKFQSDDDALIASLISDGLAEATLDAPINSDVGVSCKAHLRRDGLVITGLKDGDSFTEYSLRNLERLKALYLIEGYEEPSSGDLPE